MQGVFDIDDEEVEHDLTSKKYAKKGKKLIQPESKPMLTNKPGKKQVK